MLTSEKYLTETEWQISEDEGKAARLKNIVLGRGHDGPLSAISNLSLKNKITRHFGKKFVNITGRNDAVISRDTFVQALVEAGFAKNTEEAIQQVLPSMEDTKLDYQTTGEGSYKLHIQKVTNREKTKEAYRLSRIIS